MFLLSVIFLFFNIPIYFPLKVRDELEQLMEDHCYDLKTIANMASYAISSSLILVIHNNMIIGTNHIVLACLCRHF
jgi:hypothetical protein